MSTSNTAPVTIEYKGRIAIITLNKPGKLNALSGADYFQLTKYMKEIETHDEVFITVLIGTGKFFSAGADVSISRDLPPGTDPYEYWLRSFVANNISITEAFSNHPKILITALNGPAIGLSAAITAWSDFIYCTPSTYLLTPFSSLGLVTEGGASIAFISRLGISKANEALIMSKKITASELLQTGFVNAVFEEKGEAFRERVLEEVEDRLGTHLVDNSLVEIKRLIRRGERAAMEGQGVAEVMKGLELFVKGIPQAEFKKIASGQKRHKL